MVGSTFSHYKILDELGRGGMGIVYKAEDTKLDRIVALKFLPTHLSRDTNAKKRFIHEAKTASALDHQNVCYIHEIGETDEGQLFIAMAFYDGESLADKVERGPLTIDESVNYAMQIADGLSKAHSKGIVHRDIKSANIIVTSDGVVKLLDFGLARAVDQTQLTVEGTVLGTVSYMSPEQARGEDTDERTDIWSLGVVFYEMLTASQPFGSGHQQAVLYSLLNTEPPPVSEKRSEIPEELEGLIHELLVKDRKQRISSCEDILSRLQTFSQGGHATVELDSQSVVHLLKRPTVAISFAAVLILIIAFVAVRTNQNRSRERALSLLPRIDELALEGNFFAAYSLAEEAESILKNDSTLARQFETIADVLTVVTEPEGADVFLEHYVPIRTGEINGQVRVGTSPINQIRIPRIDHRIVVRKNGYVTTERIVSSSLNRSLRSFGTSPYERIEIRLSPIGTVPEGMVPVPGGDYQLVGAYAPTTEEASLDDFFIDRFEVSNEQFRAFITGGGYDDQTYWKYSFAKGGVELGWGEALATMKDRTGLSGPRNWTSQAFPEGTANHPVTGISWYEAAAYAEYMGNGLPTVFQWEKAARNGVYGYVGVFMPWGLVDPGESMANRANFGSSGTVTVDSYEFGLSPYGAYHMAGNAKEWNLNEMTGGYATTGGSWEDPMYLFSQYGSQDGFFSSSSLGFRTARIAVSSSGDQGSFAIDVDKRTPVYEPVDDVTFQNLLGHYAYDKRPSNAEIQEIITTEDWQRERIAYDGPDGDRVIAHLYLPNRIEYPAQCIVFVPTLSILVHSTTSETERYMSAHIRAGRAVFVVTMKGFADRQFPESRRTPSLNSVQFRDEMVLNATELRLGLDYLTTRPEIDPNKLAYLGISWGAGEGLLFSAVDERYSSVVLIGGGLYDYMAESLPAANSINFAPRIGQPKLIINGLYDEDTPYYSMALPLHNLLTEPKRVELVESGHIPPPEIRIPLVNQWLDETMGKVNPARQ